MVNPKKRKVRTAIARAAFRRFKTNKTAHAIASSPDSTEKITRALSAPKICSSISTAALFQVCYIPEPICDASRVVGIDLLILSTLE